MMIAECVEELEQKGGANGAAAFILCIKRHREEVYWDDDLGRLKVAAEIWQSEWADLMQDVTAKLGITDRVSYVEVKNKYNLTMY